MGRSGSHRSIGAWLALVLVVTVALRGTSSATAEDDPAPMRSEDVVMMVVRGVDQAAVIERIRRSTPAFDLSEEILREMRIAGVPEAVLRAMRERQDEFDRDTESPGTEDPSPVPLPATVGRSVRIAIVGPDDARPRDVVVAVPGVAPDAIAEQLSLDATPEARTIDGLALAVLCVEPRHAPDHWRAASPLGRDFLFTPRHRLLRFEAAVPEDGEGGGRSVARYRLPDGIAVPLEGEGHDLVVGLALRVGGRWFLARSASAGTIDVPDAGVDVVLRVLPSGEAGFLPDLDVTRPDDSR